MSLTPLLGLWVNFTFTFTVGTSNIQCRGISTCKRNVLCFFFFFSADKLPSGFPQITQAPSTKVVEIGHNAVLQCSAVGIPSPRISWVRDMLPVDTSKNSRYSILDTGTGMQGTLGIVTVTDTKPATIRSTARLLYSVFSVTG